MPLRSARAFYEEKSIDSRWRHKPTIAPLPFLILFNTKSKQIATLVSYQGREGGYDELHVNLVIMKYLAVA